MRTTADSPGRQNGNCHSHALRFARPPPSYTPVPFLRNNLRRHTRSNSRRHTPTYLRRRRKHQTGQPFAGARGGGFGTAGEKGCGGGGEGGGDIKTKTARHFVCFRTAKDAAHANRLFITKLPLMIGTVLQNCDSLSQFRNCDFGPELCPTKISKFFSP